MDNYSCVKSNDNVESVEKQLQQTSELESGEFWLGLIFNR